MTRHRKHTQKRQHKYRRRHQPTNANTAIQNRILTPYYADPTMQLQMMHRGGLKWENFDPRTWDTRKFDPRTWKWNPTTLNLEEMFKKKPSKLEPRDYAPLLNNSSSIGYDSSPLVPPAIPPAVPPAVPSLVPPAVPSLVPPAIPPAVPPAVHPVEQPLEQPFVPPAVPPVEQVPPAGFQAKPVENVPPAGIQAKPVENVPPALTRPVFRPNMTQVAGRKRRRRQRRRQSRRKSKSKRRKQ